MRQIVRLKIRFIGSDFLLLSGEFRQASVNPLAGIVLPGIVCGISRHPESSHILARLRQIACKPRRNLYVQLSI